MPYGLLDQCDCITIDHSLLIAYLQFSMPSMINPTANSNIKVTALPAFQDNYFWVIHDPLEFNNVVVVDPGDAEVVISALEKHDWTLQAILITHHHHDHTGGLLELKKQFEVPVYGPMMEMITGVDYKLGANDSIQVANTNLYFNIMDLPGHTLGHIAYLGHGAVFCGDTLFSAGCGRMFEGTPEGFYQSMSDLANLPDETAVYCTHEYTASNLKFANHVEPENSDIKNYADYVKGKRAKNQITLPSSIALEKTINPFLHCADPQIQQRISELSGRAFSELEQHPVNTFACMRALKDNF